MSEEKATGISLWLSAARDDGVRGHLQKVINNGGGPSFDPHITLIALPEAPEEKLEEILSKTRKIAQNIKPFEAKFTKVQTGQIWWRSVFLEVEKTDLLQELYNTAESRFGEFVANKTPFYPHLSLFYGHNNQNIISNITTSVGNCASISIKFIDVYRTVGEADKWVHLASIPLGEDTVFRSAIFINNQWQRPVKQHYLPVINPATRQAIHFYPAATAEDIDLAVEAAHKAFPSWSSLSGKERAKFLEAIADAISTKKDDLTKIEILDNGKPYEDASVDIDDTASCFRYYANQAIQLDAKQDQPLNLPDQRFSCRIRYEPVGVAGLIIPWNYPLLMAAWKLAPCLAAGCTAVLKPSELTPLSALEFGSLLLQVGLPAGVINIVTGTGPEAGEPLSKHPKVEKIAFTGSVATGAKVVASTANSIKNVTLELGGKSPFVIFDDADINQACEWIMLGIFANQGQVCSATSRALVQETIYDKLLPRLVEEVKKIKIGNGLQQDTKIGPIVSEGQYNKVIDYIKKGQQEGAKVITGGVPTAPELLKGFFVEPTIFTDVNANSTIWTEEIFGPVLCIRTFKTEEEAVAMANDNTYGLAAAVMSKDKQRCQRVSKQLRAGIVWINCSQPTFCEAPWGGMKKSGVGRELGPWGLDNYLEVKQITSYDEEDGLGYEKYLKKN